MLLLCLVWYAAPSWAEDDFLPPQQAYRYSTRIENDQLIVTWNIEKGYYLYKKRMGVALAESASGASVHSANASGPRANRTRTSISVSRKSIATLSMCPCRSRFMERAPQSLRSN